jgi:uncharacterized protein YegL
MITGADDSVARSFLSRASWNLELALSNYFDAGLTPPSTPPPVTPPQVSPPVTTISPTVPPPTLVPDDNNKLGIFVKGKNTAFPLRGLSVQAKLVHFAAEVEVVQRFVNNTDSPIEAVFLFAQDDEATIYGLEAEIDTKKVVGICKTKEDAFTDYDDSIASGHGAYLLEKDETKDQFKLSIGNLPPGKECLLTVRYVTELEQDDSDLKFTLPVTRTPLLPASSSTSQEGKLEGLQVNIEVAMPSTITKVEAISPHSIETTLNGKTAHVKFSSNSTTNLHESLRLVIGQEHPHQPQILFEVQNSEVSSSSSSSDASEEGGKETEAALLLSFYPNIKSKSEEDEFEPFCEFIFLVDQSGSMAGSRINQAKNALHLFLRSLPEGTMFNIVGFGTAFRKLFSESQEYNSTSFSAATNHVNAMKADLGGTNVLAPLQDILSGGPNLDYPRQVFLLTDGDVDNTNQVIEYVKKNSNGTRIFTFGIGADASPKLVRGVAKAGKGQAEFVASGTRLEPVVLRQTKRALQPILKNVRVEWGPLEGKIRQAPPKLPTLFDGERALVYAFIDSSLKIDDNLLAQVVDGIVVKAVTSDQKATELTFGINVEKRDQLRDLVREGDLVHRLAARAAIRQWAATPASERKHENQITELALRYQLASKFTSFVAVEERTEATEGTMKTIDVATEMINELGNRGDAKPVSLPSAAPIGAVGGAPLPSVGGGLFGKVLKQSDSSSIEQNISIDALSLGDETLQELSNQSEKLSLASESFRASPKKRSAGAGMGSFFSGWFGGGGGRGGRGGAAAVSDKKDEKKKGKAETQRNRKSSRSNESDGSPVLIASTLSVSPSLKKKEAKQVEREKETDKERTKAKAEDEEAEESGVKKSKKNVKGKGKKKLEKKNDKGAARLDGDTMKREEKSLFGEKEEEHSESDADDACEGEAKEEVKGALFDDESAGEDLFAAAPAIAHSLHRQQHQQQSELQPAFIGYTYKSFDTSSLLPFDSTPSPTSASTTSTTTTTPPASPAGARSSRASSLSGFNALSAPARPPAPAGPPAPAPAPAPVVSNSSMRPLDRLVQLQQFDGSWAADASLAASIGVDLATLQRSVETSPLGEHKGKPAVDQLWATLLALALLETKFGGEKDEWQLLATKAKKWARAQLRKLGLEAALDLDQLQTKAQEFLASVTK